MKLLFRRYVGIDYSGAQTPTSSLKGLRVYMADRWSTPNEVLAPPSPRKYWTRKEVAQWLVEILSEDQPTLVGIDHGFSFPLRYYEYYLIEPNWDVFLEDFQKHWPTDGDHVYVDFVRNGSCGNGAERAGNIRWKRITEERSGTAKSVFHFDVQGTVAKSTHSGIPWLLYIRKKLGRKVHFWPFDGWKIPAGRSVIVEAYPSLWSKSYPTDGRTADQHDAYSVAAWMRSSDMDRSLGNIFMPDLSPAERGAAQVEGWILGVR